MKFTNLALRPSRPSAFLVFLLILGLGLTACSESKPSDPGKGQATALSTQGRDVPVPSTVTIGPAVQATIVAAAQATEVAAAPFLQLPPGAVELSGTPIPTATALPPPVNAFAFTNWSRLPAPSFAPTTARLIGQINSQAPAQPTPSLAGSRPTDKKAPLTALAISPDNSVIAFADREQIWLCEASTGRVLQLIYTSSKPNYSGQPGETEERGASSLAWSSDGKKLAAGSWHGQIFIWRWEAAQQRVRPGRNMVQPYSGAAFFGDAVEIAFGPDGNFLAGFASSGSITVWNSETLQVRATFYSPYAGYLSWSPDGKRLTDEYLSVHSLESGQTFYPGEKAIVSDEQPQGVAFSPDGKKLAVSADGFELGLVDTPEGDKPGWIEAELKKIAPPRTTTGPAYEHYREGRRVVWSPDGRWVAVANIPDAGKISVWDSNGRKLLTINSSREALTGLVWPAPAVIAAAGNDGVVRLWQLLSPPGPTPTP